jgi:hypothetical protein
MYICELWVDDMVGELYVHMCTVGGWNGWGTVATYVNCGWMEWLGNRSYIRELCVDGMVGELYVHMCTVGGWNGWEIVAPYVNCGWMEGLRNRSYLRELSNSSFRIPVCFIAVKRI